MPLAGSTASDVAEVPDGRVTRGHETVVGRVVHGDVVLLAT